MNDFSFKERRLMISYSSRKNNLIIPKKIFRHRVNLIKTLKTYIKKYYNFATNKNNILYLSILYLDIIISKDEINLSYDKNLKYLCLCCFMLSLKFLGDYDLSKKIIRNFCQNYKNEYNIFEIQCIQLLDYNLIYTTVYDYFNMILNHDQKKLLEICNSLLYKICEEDLFLNYPPFYIAIALIKIGKNYINDKSYNHYNKYFLDQRVIFLSKAFNHILNEINPPNDLNLNNNDINDKIVLEKRNYMKYYENTASNNISNINIYNNNTIHNNIVIINEINPNCFNDNNNNYNSKTYLKTIYSNGNINPLKIVVNKYDNKKYNYIKVDNQNNCDYNYNDNKTYRITRLRQYKSKKENNFRNRNSFNDNNFNFGIYGSLDKEENNKTSYQIKDNKYEKNNNKSSKNINCKPISNYKSSLNFKLLSDVPKELLFKLSKNISKTFGSSVEKISVNKRKNFK